MTIQLVPRKKMVNSRIVRYNKGNASWRLCYGRVARIFKREIK